MNELKDDLQHLIDSPGWHWFQGRIDREWGAHGERFLPELKSALNLTDNDAAAAQARQIISAQAVILALMRAPQEELARLKKLDKEADSSPRKAMPQELVGQSRRGGL